MGELVRRKLTAKEVCDSKVFFDTEFEAELFLAKMVKGEDMKVYQCGLHFHITMKEKEKRRGHGANIAWCDHGKHYVPKRGFSKHKAKCRGNTLNMERIKQG